MLHSLTSLKCKPFLLSRFAIGQSDLGPWKFKDPLKKFYDFIFIASKSWEHHKFVINKAKPTAPWEMEFFRPAATIQ